MRIELGNDYSLRHFYYGDAMALTKHGNNPNIARNLRDSFPTPYTIAHARAWIQHVKEHEAKTRFIIAYKDQAIGEIGFLPQWDVHRFTAEIGYWMSEEHWGKGVMGKAVAEVSQYAFKTTDIVRLFADVVEYNIGSCKVLEKCGFKREAVFRNNIFKDGEFYDHFIFGLYRENLRSQ